jgi:hypothetical protein
MSAWIEGPYRYSLTRQTGEHAGVGTVCFVMLNPSTADATADDPTIRRCVGFDPTIRRCVGFARRWGFAAVEVVNLFAWRSTDPMVLWANQRAGVDVVGPRNIEALEAAASSAEALVCAWGKASPLAADHIRGVGGLLRRCRDVVSCLGRNLDGSPKHPLDVAGDADLTTWRAP